MTFSDAKEKLRQKWEEVAPRLQGARESLSVIRQGASLIRDGVGSLFRPSKQLLARLLIRGLQKVRASIPEPVRRAVSAIAQRGTQVFYRQQLRAAPQSVIPREFRTPLLPASIVVALLVFGSGYLLLESGRPDEHSGAFQRLARVLSRASYDWSFDVSRYARPAIGGSDVVLVYVDDASLKQLNHTVWLPLKRSLHADLIDRLTRDGARAVVMDMVFSDALDENTDLRLSEAMRNNGRVVLGIDYTGSEALSFDNLNEEEVAGKKVTPPQQLFAESAAKLGFIGLNRDSDFMVRRHCHVVHGAEEGDMNTPSSLSWAAAEQLGLKVTENKSQRVSARWMYYYGPPDTIPHLSFKDALEKQRPGFFRSKIVFVGTRSSTGQGLEKRDELRNPYSASGAHETLFMPSTEVHATEFLNLKQGDWLTHPSRAAHIGILAVGALVFGCGFVRFRPIIATGLGFVGILLVVLTVQNLFAHQHIWFDWLVIVAVQVPIAILAVVLFRSFESILHSRRLQEEQRQAYMQIRDQAALLDKAQDAIIVHDLTWSVRYWNKSSERLYGWSAAEAVNQSLGALISKADDGKIFDAFEKTLATGEWHGDLEQVSRTGTPLTVHSRWTLVSDDEGNSKAIFVINTDITEQKQLEAQFLRTQRLESIGTLAGGIAHDLNNVLSPILMGVELLKNHVTDETARKMLATMGGSAKRGSELVKQVLAFARGQQGERTLIQIPEVIQELEKLSVETFPKNIQITIDLKSVPPVLGDPTQIHQILLNLAVNARDAMSKGGQIAIAATEVVRRVPSTPLQFAGADQQTSFQKRGSVPEARYVLISVTDNGSGIAPGILEKIFDPFFTTKEPGKGTGLGLSTVLSIIKSHGGFLEVRSEVGKGSNFSVYLPAAEGFAAPTSAGELENYRGHGETIMLVDDDPAVIETNKAALAHFGYNVLTASNGAVALDLVAKYSGTVKMVVMDVMMPVMDGPTAIKELRARQPQLPVLAISGFSTPDRVRERLGDVKVPFLAKPYTTERLLKEISCLAV